MAQWQAQRAKVSLSTISQRFTSKLTFKCFSSGPAQVGIGLDQKDRKEASSKMLSLSLGWRINGCGVCRRRSWPWRSSEFPLVSLPERIAHVCFCDDRSRRDIADLVTKGRIETAKLRVESLIQDDIQVSGQSGSHRLLMTFELQG